MLFDKLSLLSLTKFWTLDLKTFALIEEVKFFLLLDFAPNPLVLSLKQS